MSELNGLKALAQAPCVESSERALAHQQQLTKPVGSLGQLEEIAIKFAGFQRHTLPDIKHVFVRIFAGDHGIAQHNVSAFGQEVTAQMVHNFLHGGAAISVLSKYMHADFHVFNMGLIDTPAARALTEPPLNTHTHFTSVQVACGTENFCHAPAMTQQQLIQCLQTGKNCIEALPSTQSVFIGGEMGIGNTTSASAIYSALLGINAYDAVGPGTGVDANAIKHKAVLIQQALATHNLHGADPLEVLRCVGGFEIAALVGAYICCAQRGIPVLVDGFITTAAALAAVHINPSVKPWFVMTHQSKEPAHRLALAYFNQLPLLDLSLRLGEGSGAAICLPIIKTALQLHNTMATFAQAGVSDANT